MQVQLHAHLWDVREGEKDAGAGVAVVAVRAVGVRQLRRHTLALLLGHLRQKIRQPCSTSLQQLLSCSCAA
jgi:hypothetical protein